MIRLEMTEMKNKTDSILVFSMSVTQEKSFV